MKKNGKLINFKSIRMFYMSNSNENSLFICRISSRFKKKIVAQFTFEPKLQCYPKRQLK